MQPKKKNLYNKIVIGVAALIWVLGMLAAGSDSPYMPWLNIVGAIVFLGASLWLGRTLPILEATGAITPKSPQAKVRVCTIEEKQNSKKQNCQMNTRYAGGACVN